MRVQKNDVGPLLLRLLLKNRACEALSREREAMGNGERRQGCKKKDRLDRAKMSVEEMLQRQSRSEGRLRYERKTGKENRGSERRGFRRKRGIESQKKHLTVKMNQVNLSTHPNGRRGGGARKSNTDIDPIKRGEHGLCGG